MDIQLGYWRWKLFLWNDQRNPYRNRPDLALTWLRQYQSNATAMAELKSILTASQTGNYVPTDTQTILKMIADKMATGEIQAGVEVCGPLSASPAGLPPDDTDQDQAAAAIASSTTAKPVTSNSPSSATSPAASTDPAPGDQDGSDAASPGADGSSAPGSDGGDSPADGSGGGAGSSTASLFAGIVPQIESTLGPNNDAAAQAQALRDAAENGTPVCEECQKAAEKVKNRKRPKFDTTDSAQADSPGDTAPADAIAADGDPAPGDPAYGVIAGDIDSPGGVSDAPDGAYAPFPEFLTEVVPDTFTPELEALAQAKTLRDAAEHGVAFCEECEKAARALRERDAALQATNS